MRRESIEAQLSYWKDFHPKTFDQLVEIVNLMIHQPIPIGWEYFCYNCGQLRLNLDKPRHICGNCESNNFVVAPAGCLNKEVLKEEYKNDKNNINHQNK